MEKLYTFDRSMELFRRAAKIIPAGIPGHLSPALTVPGSFPYYAARGEGCRYWDVDGNEYIDFMCGFGPVILGYNHPEVDAAAREEREKGGSVFNHPTVRTIELAERLVKLVPIADWAAFARNGSDVTMYSVMVAREHTHRQKILMAKGTYHGTHAWSIHGIAGVIPTDYENVLRFTWNDADELEDLVRKNEGDVAGIILTPYHHPTYADQELPAPGFMQAVRRICDEHGIVFIVDDVRAGFRLHMGGSNEYFGFKPDMLCFCKALANGYVISAAVGAAPLKAAAARVFFTGSYWAASMEIAAALKCLEVLERTDAIGHMMKMGTLLTEGLRDRARSHGLQVNVTGPPTMPGLTFANETNFRRVQRFSAEAARRGVFFHPHHNWFLMAAHQEKDIRQALEVADRAFEIVKKEFGG